MRAELTIKQQNLAIRLAGEKWDKVIEIAEARLEADPDLMAGRAYADALETLKLLPKKIEEDYEN